MHDVALGLDGSDEHIKVMPERWVDVALRNARPEADGYFLSCTNTTQIEAVSAIEEVLGKPVVNSNQSVPWASLARLRKKLAPLPPATKIGRLTETL